jgi:hypothetical protein
MWLPMAGDAEQFGGMKKIEAIIRPFMTACSKAASPPRA